MEIPDGTFEMERRHVAQAEALVARQEALIVKLVADKRDGPAEVARDLLAELRTTLSLARARLARLSEERG